MILLLVSNSGQARQGTPSFCESDALTGTTWKLVEIQSIDDSVFTSAGTEAHTLLFLGNGEVNARADCNEGRGSWASTGKSQLQFGPFAMTDGAKPESRPAVTESGGPSFDCSAASGSVQQLVCNDPSLAALDRRLDAVYRKALRTFPDDEVATLRAYQRGWIKGRDDCWKAPNLGNCVKSEYERRITELEIKSGEYVVPSPTLFRCDDGQQLSAYFYEETQLRALVLNRYPDQALLYREPSASGAKYQGRNVTFWENGAAATLEWSGEAAACELLAD